MNDRVYQIWLSLACTPDTATFPKLLKEFKSPLEVYNADEHEIRRVVGSRASDCARLIDKDLERAKSIWRFCYTKGVGILSYFDEEYPQSLRDIDTPPVLLYYRGKVPDFKHDFRCAIVGTRSITDYGRVNAYNAGYVLAKAGATIVSGMAVGVDGVALAGALAGGGLAIGVLGSGIDVCYPKDHQILARAIVKQGCIFTEYPPGTRPERYNFPRRNRIISGLCRATIVVEGREGSGAIITARCAKKQGREVFAYPGNVCAEGSQATNLLIQSGVARLCIRPEDVIRAFENEVGSTLSMFNIPMKKHMSMEAALERYAVSAITYSDNLYSRTYPYYRDKKGKAQESKAAPSAGASENQTPASEGIADAELKTEDPMNPTALSIYKKIPMDGSICTISSLFEDGVDIGIIMNIILDLEMSQCIVLLPGERVKRKFI